MEDLCRLTDLCLKTIADNFQTQIDPITNLTQADREWLFQQLTAYNIPLEEAIHFVEDDNYWERLFATRWPRTTPTRDISCLHKPKVCPTWWLNTWDLKSNSKQISFYLELFQQASYSFGLIMQSANKFLLPRLQRDHYKVSDGPGDVDIESLSTLMHRPSLKPEPSHTKKWKSLYVEHHVKEFLEHLPPREYNPERIMDLSQLVSGHIVTLHLEQLQSDVDVDVDRHENLFAGSVETTYDVDISSLPKPIIKYQSLQNISNREVLSRSQSFHYDRKTSTKQQSDESNHTNKDGNLDIFLGKYQPTTNNITAYVNALKRTPIDHIPFTILSTFENLTELSLYFGKRLDGTYDRKYFTVTEIDCKNLGYNLAKTRLKILRIHRSNLTCRKLRILLWHMDPCRTLQVLDFSHCHIGNVGANDYLVTFFESHSFIHTLTLANNRITTIGEKLFLHQGLRYLDVHLNHLDVTTRGLICNAIPSNLELLNLSGCNLIGDNIIPSLTNILRSKTILSMDLSNNPLSDKIAATIETTVDQNETIEWLDLRFCRIPNAITATVKRKLFQNRLKKFAKEQQLRIREIDSFLKLAEASELLSRTDIQ